MKECEWHRLVDSKWQKLEQELGSLHIPTEKEAINGVKRLYRHIMKKPFEGRVEVAKKRNQRTWITYKTHRWFLFNYIIKVVVFRKSVMV